MATALSQLRARALIHHYQFPRKLARIVGAEPVLLVTQVVTYTLPASLANSLVPRLLLWQRIGCAHPNRTSNYRVASLSNSNVPVLARTIYSLAAPLLTPPWIRPYSRALLLDTIGSGLYPIREGSTSLRLSWGQSV